MTQLAALPHRQCFKGHNWVQLFLHANSSLVFKTESSFSPLSPVFEVAQTISAKAATVGPQIITHGEEDKATTFTINLLTLAPFSYTELLSH